MAKIYLLIGALGLSFFSWAQYRGAGLFDDEIRSSQARSIGQRSTFHK